jgi:transcriptional regulator with XRE-family HTH domain
MTIAKTKKLGKDSLDRKLGVMTLASFLSAWRHSLEMTQGEFAKKLGISAANLCDIEKSRQLVSPKKASEIAKKIGYSETVLVELVINEQLALDGLKMRVKAVA